VTPLANASRSTARATLRHLDPVGDLDVSRVEPAHILFEAALRRCRACIDLGEEFEQTSSAKSEVLWHRRGRTGRISVSFDGQSAARRLPGGFAAGPPSADDDNLQMRSMPARPRARACHRRSLNPYCWLVDSEYSTPRIAIARGLRRKRGSTSSSHTVGTEKTMPRAD